jgi:hypothetical protein
VIFQLYRLAKHILFCLALDVQYCFFFFYMQEVDYGVWHEQIITFSGVAARHAQRARQRANDISFGVLAILR